LLKDKQRIGRHEELVEKQLPNALQNDVTPNSLVKTFTLAISLWMLGVEEVKERPE